ncbi:serine/threonine-protein kinase/endoribonuclease IRE1-like [Styela clava]
MCERIAGLLTAVSIFLRYLLFTFTEYSIRDGDSEIIYYTNKVLGDRVYEGRIVTHSIFGKPIPQDKLAVKLRTINGSLSKEEIDGKYWNEIENAIKLLAHDNVARYVRHCSCYLSNEPTVVIVTDLCNHEKLETHLPGFLVEDKKILLLQLCHGLNHIHQTNPKPIAHRDLKPSNVLLSLDGKNIKIIDFGISKEFALDENKTITKSTGFSGTLGWVASEMCSNDRSKNFEAWVKADIYSLGLLIYFIFTNGQHPYQGSPAVRHVKIQNKEKPNFSAIENDEEFHDKYLLIDLLKAMLSHEPADRPGITKILQHFFTWNEEKKVIFISDCQQYFGQPCDEVKILRRKAKRQLEINGTVEQRMAYIDRESINSSVDSEKHVWTEEERKALERIHEIIGEDWVKLIKEKLEDPRSESYKNSFTDLVRYIRNTHAHFDEKPEKMKAKLGSRNKGMWNFFASNFPEFFPHLFNLIKNDLKEDHKEKYLAESSSHELSEKNGMIDDKIHNYFSFSVMLVIIAVIIHYILWYFA